MSKLAGHVKPVRALAFSPDSQLLLTGSDDSYVGIFDVRGGKRPALMALVDQFAHPLSVRVVACRHERKP